MNATNTASDLPKVAVVTPVYNGGAYLEETMECVQAQTYPNLVHIVLNNASTDNTAEILEKFKDAKVPVEVHVNDEVLNINANWNAAIALTPKDAKYIRFLCADDLMTPDFVEKTVTLAETDSDIQLVGTYVTKNEERMQFNWPGQAVVDGKEIARGFFKGEMGFFAIHSLMRADVLEWRNPLFDEIMLGMDFEAYISILKRGKFGMIHEDLGWVRVHEGSQTSTTMLKKNTHFADWHTTLYRHGPDVFTPQEFSALARRYELYYLGKCRGWRRMGGDDAIALHYKTIAANRGPVTTSDKVASLMNGAMIKFGLRPGWPGWPN